MPKAPRLTAPEAEAMLLRAGFIWLRSKGSHRIYQAGIRRIVLPFHTGVALHPKTVKEVLDGIAESAKTPTDPA